MELGYMIRNAGQAMKEDFKFFTDSIIGLMLPEYLPKTIHDGWRFFRELMSDRQVSVSDSDLLFITLKMCLTVEEIRGLYESGCGQPLSHIFDDPVGIITDNILWDRLIVQFAENFAEKHGIENREEFAKIAKSAVEILATKRVGINDDMGRVISLLEALKNKVTELVVESKTNTEVPRND